MHIPNTRMGMEQLCECKKDWIELEKKEGGLETKKSFSIDFKRYYGEA